MTPEFAPVAVIVAAQKWQALDAQYTASSAAIMATPGAAYSVDSMIDLRREVDLAANDLAREVVAFLATFQAPGTSRTAPHPVFVLSSDSSGATKAYEIQAEPNIVLADGEELAMLPMVVLVED